MKKRVERLLIGAGSIVLAAAPVFLRIGDCILFWGEEKFPEA